MPKEEVMRQTKTGNSGKGAKRCSACGAKLWLKDYNTGQFSGPWHFQDCPSIPGGAELTVANIQEREQRLDEKTVPREQGMRILRAINLIMASSSDKIMLERKAAIQGEIREMCKEKVSVGGVKP